MISAALIIALIVLSIHYTMLDGEIFGKLGNWFAKNLPAKIHPSVFECNVCMTPWYGSVVYVLIWGVNLQWPVVVIAAMGINVVINKWAPKEEIEISGKDEEPVEVVAVWRNTPTSPADSTEPVSVVWDVKINEDAVSSRYNKPCPFDD